MQYEWDDKKREANIAKHGIDFTHAAHFEWEHATHEPDQRMHYDELRIVSFAPVHGRIFALYWTQRGERVRIIGFRKANSREVKRYESKT